MVIIIIEVHHQITIIFISQNIILTSLATIVNVLVIFRRNAKQKNKIYKIEENLETISTTIFALLERTRTSLTLHTQHNKNLHLLYRI